MLGCPVRSGVLGSDNSTTRRPSTELSGSIWGPRPLGQARGDGVTERLEARQRAHEDGQHGDLVILIDVKHVDALDRLGPDLAAEHKLRVEAIAGSPVVGAPARAWVYSKSSNSSTRI